MFAPWFLLVESIVGYLLYESRLHRPIPLGIWRQYGPVLITGPEDRVILLDPDRLIWAA